MGRWSEKLIAALLILFLLVYVGYQSFGYYRSPLQTETAFQYSVSHALVADGVAVRDEVVIDEVSGADNSVFEDGTRVARGQAVAEFYGGSISDAQIYRIRELEREIASLTEAQNPAIANFSNADSINRDIRENIGKMSYMSSTGRFTDLEDVSLSLVGLLNQRQVAVGREEDYEDRIAALQAEHDRLGGNTDLSEERVQVATAPAAGYFVRGVDGLEHLSRESMKNWSVDGYRTLIESAEISSNAQKAGKVVTTSSWYFMALVPKFDVQWMRPGQSVEMEFENIDMAVPGTVVEVVDENYDDDAILVVHSGYVDGDLLNLRLEQATIHIEQHTGLRISRSAVRSQKNGKGEDVLGVFVLSSNIVRFKKIDPLYEETGFVLSRESTGAEPAAASESSEESRLSIPAESADGESAAGRLPDDYPLVDRFDQIIVKGRDLYHGKVVD